MIEVEIDNNGYPTDETLLLIEEMDIKDVPKFILSLENMELPYATVWNEKTDGGVLVKYATGGWSGNEDIIGAMLGNMMLRMMYYYEWKRGGLHVFLIPTNTEE